MSKRLLVLLLLLAPGVFAHADTYTVFNLQSTFQNSAGDGGNIDGTLTYDDTTMAFSSVDATTSNFPATDGSNGQVLNFIQVQSQDPSNGEYGVLFGNNTGAGVFLDLPNSDFTQPTISICSLGTACQDGPTMYSNTGFSYTAVSGTLSTGTAPTAPAAVTPEPSSLTLLGSGILSLAGVMRRYRRK